MGRKRKNICERKEELVVVKSDYHHPAEMEKLRKEKEARDEVLEDAWAKVWETNGFDMGDFIHYKGMIAYSGLESPLVVKLYAMLGLHSHNMLELQRVDRFNVFGMGMPVSYYITSSAYDAALPGSDVPFQTLVDEGRYNAMNVTCHIARIKKTGNKCVDDWEIAPDFLDCMQVPEWPSKIAFAHKQLFYEVQKSEWEAKDWIRLYLELAFVTTNRDITNWWLFYPSLSGLKILNVVVESTEEPPNARVLQLFTSVVFYITYDHDMGEDGVFRNPRAIVRRTVDPISKRFCLVGKILQDSTE